MNKQTHDRRQQILHLIDGCPPSDYREFLGELAEDVRARLECLDEEERDAEEEKP